MRIVFSDDAQDFQRRNWSGLVHEDPAGTFFHQPAFLKLYWEEFAETPEHLLPMVMPALHRRAMPALHPRAPQMRAHHYVAARPPARAVNRAPPRRLPPRMSKSE